MTPTEMKRQNKSISDKKSMNVTIWNLEQINVQYILLRKNHRYIHPSSMIQTSKETSKVHEVCFAIRPSNKDKHECTMQAALKCPNHQPQCTTSEINSNQVLI